MTTCRYNVYAEFERAARVAAHSKGVVHDERAFVLFADRADTFKVRNVETRVPRAIMRRLVPWMSQQDRKVPTSDILSYPRFALTPFAVL